MFQLNIELQGLHEFNKNISKLTAAAPEAVAHALHKVARRIEAKATRNAPVMVGLLRGSHFTSPPMITKYSITVVTGFNTEYAAWVHQGRGPGKMPPIEPILNWVIIKNRGAGQLDDPEQVARATAVMIGRWGTKPNPFLLKALEEEAANIASKIKFLTAEELGRIRW